MIRGAISENTESLGARYRTRVYLYDWGVHLEAHGDTPEKACFYVKRALHNAMRKPESIEFHGVEGLDVTITYKGSL